MCIVQSIVDDINANHMLLESMIKNQETRGTFVLSPPCYKWVNYKYLPELFLHLPLSLYAGIHFGQVLDVLSCISSTLS